MEIKQIQFITEDEIIEVEGLELEILFKNLKHSYMKSLLKSSWEGLNKFIVIKIIGIGFMRRLIGKKGMTPGLHRKILPYINNVEDENINFVKVIFKNNKTLIFDTKDINMIDMLYDIRDVIHTNQYNISEQNIKNKIVVDCGSNKGAFSLFAIFNGAKKVYAFEPVSSSCQNINKTIKLNKMGNKIFLFPEALGEKGYNTKVSFRYTGDGGGQINSKLLLEKDWKSENIRVTSLDECMLGRIDFIKIDTEGFEANVLKGAKETIKRYKPILSLSAYHKPEDKIELPKLIKSIRNDYKIKLNKFSEEDFYCWIDDTGSVHNASLGGGE